MGNRISLVTRAGKVKQDTGHFSSPLGKKRRGCESSLSRRTYGQFHFFAGLSFRFVHVGKGSTLGQAGLLQCTRVHCNQSRTPIAERNFDLYACSISRHEFPILPGAVIGRALFPPLLYNPMFDLLSRAIVIIVLSSWRTMAESPQ